MLNNKRLLYIGLFIVVFIAAVSVTVFFDEVGETTEAEKPTLIQLEEEGRPDAATMGLVGVPPTKPADHIDRWVPELRHEGCLTCHQVGASGAPKPPEDHYIDGNQDGQIFRDNCIQCHATQNDQKTAFNSVE
ncbi:Nitrate reductase cytochrome c-type subunit (NapB) [Mesobacillus persicus]|uniref:Nitrate reductase cytochrome c-type subunit (NapB) n=1 Tax=Mesobacillus persicus TaxID=930146 RepID=A0A1H8F0U2_9BACI|nr:nitrate reductase cytochrome c-type subunit [Mesobacillus persicus]SEN24618.1 Nitrate reductase cytochrome c-type subunit (NapB) [Mesobacillus persicus]